jgi:hypothetical protein
MSDATPAGEATDDSTIDPAADPALNRADAATRGGVGASPQTCDLCDRESRHLTRWLNPDGSVEHVCWSCLQRREKRVNLNQRWKRERR